MYICTALYNFRSPVQWMWDGPGQANLKDKSFKTAADNFDIAGFWKRLGNLPLNLYAPQNKQVVPNFARSVTTFLYTKNPDVAIIWSAQV